MIKQKNSKLRACNFFSIYPQQLEWQWQCVEGSCRERGSPSQVALCAYCEAGASGRACSDQLSRTTGRVKRTITLGACVRVMLHVSIDIVD